MCFVQKQTQSEVGDWPSSVAQIILPYDFYNGLP